MRFVKGSNDCNHVLIRRMLTCLNYLQVHSRGDIGMINDCSFMNLKIKMYFFRRCRKELNQRGRLLMICAGLLKEERKAYLLYVYKDTRSWFL